MGYHAIPHTADIRLEAWAPSREECLAEAVTALVATFAEVSDDEPTADVEVLIDPGTDEDMLVDLLDEVIYRLETAGQVPVATRVEPLDGGLRVRWQVTDAGRADPVGAAPKAVSLHDLSFAPDPQGRWVATVTVDV